MFKIFYGEIVLYSLALKVSFDCQVNQLRFPLWLRLKEGHRMEDVAQVTPCQPRGWCWWQCRWCYRLGRRTAWSQENFLENSIESKWQEMPSEFKSIKRINQSLLIFCVLVQHNGVHGSILILSSLWCPHVSFTLLLMVPFIFQNSNPPSAFTSHVFHYPKAES